MRSSHPLAWPLAIAVVLSPALAFADDGGAQDGGADDGGAQDGGPLHDAGDLDAGGDDDGGALDAGPSLDAGVVDAGPQRPPEEGIGCDPLDGANCGSLYCVPYPSFPDYGVCRTGCEDNDDCYPGRTCQDIVDKTTLETLYRACTTTTSWRDGECHAPGDPDTCSAEMSCHIARGSDSPDGVSFNCKLTCELGDVGDAGSCPTGERCVSSRFVQGFEPSASDPDAAMSCTPALCDDDSGSCECSEGFTCVQLASGATVCADLPGECGTPVRGMVSGEIMDGGYLPFDVLCNRTSDHRFCDNSGFEGLENPGANLCILEGQLGVPDEGLCIPYCGAVDVDVNANGVIDDGERGGMLDCPVGEQCTRRLARELFLGPGPQQAGGPYGLRGCSVVDCPAGSICAACGPGQPECLELQEPVGVFTGVCIGPVLTCEYAPDYDAGPSPFVDAGVSVDAGVGTDAGNDPPAGDDAGAGGDDNDDDNDDRLRDDISGPQVNADGCACATSDGPAGALGLLGLLSLVVVLRPRRRR